MIMAVPGCIDLPKNSWNILGPQEILRKIQLFEKVLEQLVKRSSGTFSGLRKNRVGNPRQDTAPAVE